MGGAGRTLGSRSYVSILLLESVTGASASCGRGTVGGVSDLRGAESGEGDCLKVGGGAGGVWKGVAEAVWCEGVVAGDSVEELLLLRDLCKNL